MPAKNALKHYEENGYYHLYDRGVAKNEIFLDEQDYAVFLSYLKEYLSPPVPPSEEEIRQMNYKYLRKNYLSEIKLLAFCLMPNHFHFLVRQRGSRAIESFMRSLLTRYSVYFNRHHERVGHLFQDVYKGILVPNEAYFLWLGRYIHRNPLGILLKKGRLSDYPYSSYPAYLGLQKIAWLSPEDALASYPKRGYRDFVEEVEDNDAPEALGEYTLEH